MEIKINKEKCLICGMCASANNDVFDFNDEGLIEVKNENINDDNIEEIIEIKNNCPVGAIEEKENNQ